MTASDGGPGGAYRDPRPRIVRPTAPGQDRPRLPSSAVVQRFTDAERALHWATAVAVLACALTGLVLYVGPLTALVGRRTLVKDVHVVAGLAMPVPLVLAYAGRWRSSVRADVRRLGRWTRADRRWLLSRGRDASDEVGKFNAGQKANAAFVAGMIPVMVVTGSIMRWYEPFDLRYRTGATFVHDWTAVATWVVVTGHILFALADRGSLRGMLTGRVGGAWAERHHPRWAAEIARRRTPDDAGVGEPVERPLR
ncbi:MAG: cytochrome b/b6 domain-containing protein [Acidimicrobiales bacterium]|nr:cytochrome b/b6 domain-containing protein [Acidimicrobiales bacterium]